MVIPRGAGATWAPTSTLWDPSAHCPRGASLRPWPSGLLAFWQLSPPTFASHSQPWVSLLSHTGPAPRPQIAGTFQDAPFRGPHLTPVAPAAPQVIVPMAEDAGSSPHKSESSVHWECEWRERGYKGRGCHRTARSGSGGSSTSPHEWKAASQFRAPDRKLP